MHLRNLTSRLRNESGQAAVEFALVVPFLIAFVFLIAGFGRAFNAYNDLNQMAADGARFAAVGNFPGASGLLKTGDTTVTKAATICGPIYLSGSDPNPADDVCPAPDPPSKCKVGTRIWIRAEATVPLFPLPLPVDPLEEINPLHPKGSAEMRVERCPS